MSRRTRTLVRPRSARPRPISAVAIGIAPESRPRVPSTALHEAGHAVVAILCGIPVRRVAIGKQVCPGGGQLVEGYCSIERLDIADLVERWEEVAIPRMAAIYGGPLGENLYHRANGGCIVDCISPPYPDEEQLQEIVNWMICSGATDDGRPIVHEENRVSHAEMIAGLHARASSLAGKLIDAHVDTVLAVAARLMEEGVIEGPEVTLMVLARAVNPC